MSDDRSYIEANRRELDRMRALVDRLGEAELASQANDYWTVAGVLAHIAFWDSRVLALAAKLERGMAFTPDDEEPEDADWINDTSRPLLHAIPPLEAARLAVSLAEQTDAKVASLPPERLYPNDPHSPIPAFRSDHRGEHLDELESTLGRGG